MPIQQHGPQQGVCSLVGDDLGPILTTDPVEVTGVRGQFHLLLLNHHSQMECGGMADSKRMRQSIRIGIDRLIHGVVECAPEEIVPRLRLNTHEGTHVAFFRRLPVPLLT